ncbi:hypothetical protein Poly51_43340 [Rubripirellula tenax]|uniref:Uncharacterized protein n=1 Tax=Rubripirellula tenax TaxID=2528015 RepID=A0A5C6ERU2_9BACT|nr:hypothetical protein [Rubripirellula tenax]TWU51040.1 hypothetical protein Poly51_43340 [Rubripirellula tenax]
MRFDSITAAVTRNLVNAMVREITVVRSFVAASILHRWLHRMPLFAMPSGMSSYLLSSITPDDFVALVQAGSLESECLSGLASTKRGGVKCQPCLAMASYPARFNRG